VARDFFNQSQSEVKQNQSKTRITFDSQLKTALRFFSIHFTITGWKISLVTPWSSLFRGSLYRGSTVYLKSTLKRFGNENTLTIYYQQPKASNNFVSVALPRAPMCGIVYVCRFVSFLFLVFFFSGGGGRGFIFVCLFVCFFAFLLIFVSSIGRALPWDNPLTNNHAEKSIRGF